MPASPEGHVTTTVDLTIVGAGASATHTLLALLRELSETVEAALRPARILVIERDPQFFSGVAYGNRSGRASLTLSTLEVFLPDEERAGFIAWVESQGDDLRSTADPAWVERHLDDITAGRWAELFVPRRWYGDYLANCARTAIDDAQSVGVADVDLLTADVTSVERLDGRLLVAATEPDGRAVRVDTAALVLATGSPPTRRLPADAPANGVVHDVYEPGLDATLARLHDRLADLPVADRRILLVGGNASALEFVSASRDVVRAMAARLTVLSPAGRPRNWRRRRAGEVAELPAIAALRTKVTDGERITAAELFDAMAADLRAAADAGTNVAAVRDLIGSIPYFLGHFDATERAAMAGRHGIPISSLLRQDCDDAVEILEAAVATGVVDFQAGRLQHCRTDGRYLRVTVRDEHGCEHQLDTRYGAVVGAVGFEGVSATTAPLIRQLLDSGIVAASSSDAGLRVDSRYRASPGVFVVGPLLAGNAHPNMLIWHAESVRRIMAIAPDAASSIARELILVVRSDLADSAIND
jgi:uncharacterized NAD(P)/FAD-binding protein YdhS